MNGPKTAHITHQCDVLVIGGGLAAMRAAIEARQLGRDVIMLNRGQIGRSGSSALTGTGFAAVFPELVPQDSLEIHLGDTVRGGAYVNNVQLAQILVQEAPARMRDLQRYGVVFDGDNGRPVARPSGEHSYPRVYVCKAHRGIGMTLPTRAEVDRLGIRALEKMLALELLLDDREVGGVVAVDRTSGELVVVRARQTVLATGGAGRLFSVTSNPRDVIGTSYTLGLRAGATLVDMEFVQFYPWRLLAPIGRDTRVPVQPTTFAMGGMLFNTAGERFAMQFDPVRGEATTRDLAARGIFEQSRRGLDYDGGVRLDISALTDEQFAIANPRIAEIAARKWNIRETLMTVTPEAHFCMGGLLIDEDCRTDVPRLLAAGESGGGVHGANRLNANAMAETQVFGTRAGRGAAAAADEPLPALDGTQIARVAERLAATEGPSTGDPTELARSLRQLMWKHVGIIREEAGLETALSEIDALSEQLTRSTAQTLSDRLELLELDQMLDAARSLAAAARERRESRGAHFRDDFPATDDDRWLANIRLRHEGGNLKIWKVPVPIDPYAIAGEPEVVEAVAAARPEFSE